MSSPVQRGAALLGRHLRAPAIGFLLRTALTDRRVALCLHRVGNLPQLVEPKMAACTIPERRLDQLIDLLLSSRPAAHPCWLTVTFDDGYEDGARYVASRASRYPGVEFIFFVCPEKTERGVGFRWDAVDNAVRSGRNPREAETAVETAPDVLLENQRAELLGLGHRPRYRLANVDTVCALGRHPNVSIGNHTNGHFKPVSLSDDQARLEYRRSIDEFGRLFASPTHFAFPFGKPRTEVDRRHIDIVRELGAPFMWSTESRPYDVTERQPGAVLPRFPIDGTWAPQQTAALIAIRSLIHRFRGRRFGERSADFASA